MRRGFRRHFATLSATAVLLALVGCGGGPSPVPPPGQPAPTQAQRLSLGAVSFSALPGWQEDHLAQAVPAFLRSCAQLAKLGNAATVGPSGLNSTAADWRSPCAAAAQVPLKSADADQQARRFFETYFAPYIVGSEESREGLFTGYYEPELKGSRRRTSAYATPLLKRPPDLVMVDLSRFRPAWRGERIAGRVTEGNLVPYESRVEIERGALDHYNLAFLWAENPVDLFFLQVPGSGRVRLPDGSLVHVAYDGQNGHPYVSIGKLLVQRGEMTQEQVTAQAIRAWIKAHPKEGHELMDQNPSYVFFKFQDGEGPVGSEGVVLTPGRSLAVDRSFLPLGAPVFLDVADGEGPMRRLMVAQDTGGAITGPVRGDVFWGAGARAEERAGTMKARGNYYILLPRTVSPPRLVAAPPGSYLN
jgi:membrane-bound lytic murein transglycosylase A